MFSTSPQSVGGGAGGMELGESKRHGALKNCYTMGRGKTRKANVRMTTQKIFCIITHVVRRVRWEAFSHPAMEWGWKGSSAGCCEEIFRALLGLHLNSMVTVENPPTMTIMPFYVCWKQISYDIPKDIWQKSTSSGPRKMYLKRSRNSEKKGIRNCYHLK